MSDAHRRGDTMADAIALSSPSGRMSKRARAQAVRRLGLALFPAGTFLAQPAPTVAEQAAQLRRTAANLRDLAGRGMCRRKYTREAERIDAEAAELETETTLTRPAELDARDEAYERAAHRARMNDFADTDGKDWT